jgi:stage II sporulation protein D
MLHRVSANLNGSSLTPVDEWLYPAGAVVQLKSKEQGPEVSLIQVMERDNSWYRGEMELSSSMSRLALVNVLPLESYLYSVAAAEMATGWPLEALKAQAVLARTYALAAGNKYGIANLTDTTRDQAYAGYQKEAADVRKAVDQTAGQVLAYKGNLASAFYYSNAGGVTADGSEVWGNQVPYMRPVNSPDTAPLKAAPKWYRVARLDGSFGYVAGSALQLLNDRNALGFTAATVKANTQLYSGPSQAHQNAGTLTSGERVLVLEETAQDNAYSWIAGPFNGQELALTLTKNLKQPFAAPIVRLEVTKRGVSGRVMAMEANGAPLSVSYPDGFRTAFGGGTVMRSTLFEVEETGRYRVLGSDGRQLDFPESDARSLKVISASDKGGQVQDVNGGSDAFLLWNGNSFRIATETPRFRFIGKGFGHGLGMSQWGARAMAEQGYDYKEILAHYYPGTNIGKQ